jgi:linoleoyl-CoA desaturase
MKTINFSRVDKAKFFRTLNKRVNTYFKENNIKRTGNWKLYSKAVVMFSLFLIPFIVVLSVSMPQWAMVALMVLSIVHTYSLVQLVIN